MQNEGYKTAFRATAILGGVQILTILLNIIKSKIIALWMGTLGFGVISIFNTMINLIYSATNLGLQNSAVRDFSIINQVSDYTKIAHKKLAITRWVLVTSILGAMITLFLSSKLSVWLFDDSSYVIQIRIVSIVVFLSGIYNAHYAFLQGVRRIDYMAKATIFGAAISLALSIPIYYYFRIDGIVYSLIVSALITTLVSHFFAKKYKLPKVTQSIKQTYYLGKSTVILGIAMSLSGISVLLVQFITKAYISSLGDISDVGLYQAGWAINASYLGMVFTAISKDYFPRLSSVQSDRSAINKIVNEQAEIAIIILAPLIIIMLIFLEPIILLLYSNDFVDIIPMTRWLLIGSLVKAGSWGLSYVFLAKNDSKLFLFNELGIKVVTIPAYLLSYKYFGLVGIGYAFSFVYCVFLSWLVLVSHSKYNIRYNNKFWRLFIILLLSLIIYFILSKITDNIMIGVGCATIIIIYSFYELYKRIDIISLLKKVVICKKKNLS